MNTTLIKRNTLILETVHETDQQAIKDFRLGRITASDFAGINDKNIGVVKKVIAEMGFPTVGLTSIKAYKAAVLVVLHSGDLELLNQSIETLRNADPASIQKRDIAYMIDKMRVIQNLPQLYGTQYRINKTGKVAFIDIERSKDLEKRRAEYGMESFEEYRKVIEKSLQTKQVR